MTKSEIDIINNQIKRLQEKKLSLTDEFICQCQQINKEIEYYKKLIKADEGEEE